jgi:hypothetical protein
MDPNENIKRQIEIANEIIELDIPDEAVANLGSELAELVIALDEWRRKGGYDPYRAR